ncbi:MAG: hypothetical protein M1838_000074 [Thelocarpon superellum]|nr:MAG: hypothetical protein M1838_000074 [Thelocarpon superellum]
MSKTFVRSSGILRQFPSVQPPLSTNASPLEYIDRSLAVIGENMVTKDHLEKTIAGVTSTMDRRFGEVDRRFDEADRRFDTLVRRLEEDRRRSFNMLSIRGWDRIHAIGVFNEDGEYQLPKYFPDTVLRFWKLKMPKRIHKLVDLIKFYGIEGHEQWGAVSDDGNNDSDDSDGLTTPNISVETAVRKHPEHSLRALAARLGLVYEKVSRFMAKVDEYYREHDGPPVATKRAPSERGAEYGRASKIMRYGGAAEQEQRQKGSESSSSAGPKQRPVPSSPSGDMPKRPGNARLPLEVLLRGGKSTPSSEHSVVVSERILWDHTLPVRYVPPPSDMGESQGSQGKSAKSSMKSPGPPQSSGKGSEKSQGDARSSQGIKSDEPEEEEEEEDEEEDEEGRFKTQILSRH